MNSKNYSWKPKEHHNEVVVAFFPIAKMTANVPRRNVRGIVSKNDKTLYAGRWRKKTPKTE